MTYLFSGAAFLWTQVSLWAGRANSAWGGSRVWGSGSSFETDSTNNFNSYQTWLAAAHSDLGVYTNRYNAGYGQGQADQRNALPAAYQLTPTINATSWATSETTLMTITVNRSGYWWAACTMGIFAGGGGSQVTTRLRMSGTQVASVTVGNPPGQYQSSGLLAPSAPVFMTSGQTIIMTAQNDAGTQNSEGFRTNLLAGFVPTPGNPA
jgi:hypothetical protein